LPTFSPNSNNTDRKEKFLKKEPINFSCKDDFESRLMGKNSETQGRPLVEVSPRELFKRTRKRSILKFSEGLATSKHSVSKSPSRNNVLELE
jgi:hypothetical protein